MKTQLARSARFITYIVLASLLLVQLLMLRLEAAPAAMISPSSTVPPASQHDRSVDFQFRIPLHLQYIPEQLNMPGVGNFGLAAWTVFPDITAKHNETAHVMVAGPLLQYGHKESWVEFMGGVRNNEDGYHDTMFNMRMRDRSFGPLALSVDFAYFPQRERSRTYGLVAADLPFSVANYEMRYGLEKDVVYSLNGGRDSFGAGPRFVFPIPLAKLNPHLSSSLTIAYQWRNDRDFLRCYLGLTYVFGGNSGKGSNGKM